MRTHLLALEMSLSKKVFRGGGGGGGKGFEAWGEVGAGEHGGGILHHDETLLHHMASKWKRWASCLFSRSSAFWTHTHTDRQTQKHTVSHLLSKYLTINQLVRQWEVYVCTRAVNLNPSSNSNVISHYLWFSNNIQTSKLKFYYLYLLDTYRSLMLHYCRCLYQHGAVTFFPTTEKSNTADNNKFACFSCSGDTQCVSLRVVVSCTCAEQLGIFLSWLRLTAVLRTPGCKICHLLPASAFNVCI